MLQSISFLQNQLIDSASAHNQVVSWEGTNNLLKLVWTNSMSGQINKELESK